MSTVYVKNISGTTSEKEIKEFFSFCGKITKLEVTPAGETQDAVVTFEKETAAKTALLLDNTQLGKTQVSVSSASSTKDEEENYTHNADRDSDEITQEEKPRSRIIAEYLAHGYVIGDTAAQRAIDLDHKHGVTSRFLQTLQQLDSRTHATDRAKSVDQTYGITNTANKTASSILSGLNSYYEKAAGTPTGQKLVNFYTQSQRQVIDIHNEARRLADLKKQEAGGSSTETCKCGSTSSCTCAPGTCGCANCAKTEGKTAPVLSTAKTACDCVGNDYSCACEKGKCACAGCAKGSHLCEYLLCRAVDEMFVD